MGFKGMRGPLIIGFGILIIVLLAIALSQGGAPSSTNPAGRAVCTIKAEPGIAYVIVNNRNTAGGDRVIESLSLPFSFNFTKGDQLIISAVAEENYLFNVWSFTTGEWAGTWDRHNALTIQPNKDLTIIASVLYIEPAPTPTPTASVSP